jgi:hypothetical protein
MFRLDVRRLGVQNFDWEHRSAFGDSLLEIRRLLKD